MTIGFRVVHHVDRPEEDLIAAFAGVPTSVIADAMSRFFCLDAEVIPYNTSPLVGPAVTVRVRPGDNLLLHKALDLANPGDVIVVDGNGDRSRAIAGENMVQYARSRGIRGFVIDGAIRDAAAIRRLDFPVYARGATPQGPYKDGPGEINTAVACGGVVVNPGDIIIGDADGVVIVAKGEARAIRQQVERVLAKEAAAARAIEAGTWDRAWIDEVLDLKGCEWIDRHKD